MNVQTTAAAAAIVGLGLRLPEHPSAVMWLAGEASDAPPRGALIEPRSRRRSSPFTRAVAEAYAEALEGSGLDAKTVATVFGSALGEAGTMIALLDQMCFGTDPMSPMAFAMSVHNAASGVVSISTQNRGYTTSLGADHDTPAMALVEALGLLATGYDAVIVACGDDMVPVDLVGADQGWAMAVGALALVPVAAAPAGALRIGHPFIGAGPAVAPAAVADAVAANPSVGVVDLVDAALRGRFGAVALDRGSGGGWRVELSGPAR